MELRIPEIDDLRAEISEMRAMVAHLLERIEPPADTWDTKRVAQHYGVTEKTVRTWVGEGRLEVQRIGKKMAFDPRKLPKAPR